MDDGAVAAAIIYYCSKSNNNKTGNDIGHKGRGGEGGGKPKSQKVRILSRKVISAFKDEKLPLPTRMSFSPQ